MKKSSALRLKLDEVLSQHKLSSNEMKAINGGFPCYCNGVYKGSAGSVSECCSKCGVNC